MARSNVLKLVMWVVTVSVMGTAPLPRGQRAPREAAHVHFVDEGGELIGAQAPECTPTGYMCRGGHVCDGLYLTVTVR